MVLFNELQNLMIKYGFRPNRKLSQNFVVNEGLIQKLVALADLKKSDTVLEIGPGTGFLSRELLKNCPVVAVELDQNLCTLLEEELDKSKLTLICSDFLEAKLPKFNKVVSLPPYCHSSAIMLRLFLLDFELAVLVLQKEFAEKLMAQPGFDQYSALSVLTQHAFDLEAGQVISPACFFPRPKEESRILILKSKKPSPAVADREGFSLFVKTVFRFRNKNLKNALEKSRQFLLPNFKISEQDFEKRAALLPNLDEKLCQLEVQTFAEAFNKLFD
jgi:16S rRNA (adenine1518-N6/adenine1519-N6)-dimethyltransferase